MSFTLQAEDAFYYRFPRQYLGTIQYDRMPCKPYSLYGTVLDLENGCPEVPTDSPTVPLPTLAPVVASDSPTKAPQESTATASPTISKPPVDVPTMAPTEPRPTVSPSTQEPTTSPVIPMRANVISVFRNVPERDMTSREIEKFLDITMAFLVKHTSGSMTIEGIDLWHQKLTMIDADIDATGSSKVSRGNERSLQQTRDLQAKQQHEEDIPQVTAVEVTMILRISVATLPLEYLGDLAAITIDNEQAEYLALLNEQSAFYTYFKEMDGIQSIAIERVTNAPTEQPTTTQHYLDMEEAEITSNANDKETEDSNQTSIMVFVGIGIGVLWLCLTVVSISYVINRRARMQEERDMNELLRQEKVDPTMEATVAVGVVGEGNSDRTAVDEENPKNDKDEMAMLKASYQPRRMSKVDVQAAGSKVESSNNNTPSIGAENRQRSIKLDNSDRSQPEQADRKSSKLENSDENVERRRSSRLDDGRRRSSRVDDGRRRSSVNNSTRRTSRRTSSSVMSSLKSSLTGSFGPSVPNESSKDTSDTPNHHQATRRTSRQRTSSFGESLRSSLKRKESPGQK